MVEQEVNNMIESLKRTMELALEFNVEEAQDVGTFNNLAMRICEAEMDYAKELQAVTEAKACASVEEFDQILQYHQENADGFMPKDSRRYKNFQKDLEHAVNKAKNANVLDESVALTEEQLNESQHAYLDPITKRPIENPVRNKRCNHIYGKNSITELIRQNPRCRCPIVGCPNKNFVKLTDLVEADDMMDVLTQQRAADGDMIELDE